MDDKELKHWITQELDGFKVSAPDYKDLMNRRERKPLNRKTIWIGIAIVFFLGLLLWIGYRYTKEKIDQPKAPIASQNYVLDQSFGTDLFSFDQKNKIFGKITEWESPTDFLLP